MEIGSWNMTGILFDILILRPSFRLIQMHGVEFPWPNPDKPMMFWQQLGQEEISASGQYKCGWKKPLDL